MEVKASQSRLSSSDKNVYELVIEHSYYPKENTYSYRFQTREYDILLWFLLKISKIITHVPKYYVLGI